MSNFVCRHRWGTIPCVGLEPMSGAGTIVGKRHHRNKVVAPNYLAGGNNHEKRKKHNRAI